MYNQSYEDYMRSVLGYSCMPEENPTYDNYMPYPAMNSNNVVEEMDCEELYPDIYRIINPMVCKACNENVKPITKEVVEEITEMIYQAVETTEMQVKVKQTKVELKNGDVRNPNVKKEDLPETRQQNFLLRDLIKILVLKQLLQNNRPPRPPFPGPNPNPPRPPFPPRPPRPPFPGGPGPVVPPTRPQPRGYDDYFV